jgi:epoxyqueuosine reductase
LVRNAAIVAGNLRSQTAIPRLIELLLDDPEHMVRGHAAWALGQIGGSIANKALEEAKESETDPVILAEIEAASKLL